MATHQSFYEAQLLIDEEIADLTVSVQHEIMLLEPRRDESIRLLKTRRNELAPASKLPDEILLQVFLISRDSTDLHLKNWHQVTHICRYWRHVAVGSPSLWTRLYNPPQKLIQLMLDRSQSAPLDVFFSGGRSKNSIQTLTTILHEIKRIQILSLLGISTILMDSAQTTLASLGQEASLLEELQISVSGRKPPLKFALDVFRPKRLLRTLLLSGLKFDWNIVALPNLTYLDLSGEISGEVSGAQFAEALRQMPKLEVLCINWRGAAPEGVHLPVDHARPIHLSRLKSLDIYNADQTRIEWLLAQMTHPRLHELDLGSSGSMANNVGMCRLVTSSIEKGDFSSLRCLIIYDDHFTLSALPGKFDHHGAYIEIYMRIASGFGTDCSAVLSILSCITPFDSSNLSPLQYLSLKEPLDITFDEFIHLFAYLPHLESIEVDQELGPILFDALATTSTLNTATPSTLIPFPKLQSITWLGVQYPGGPISMLPAAVFDDLYSGLRSRHAHGAPITKLELVNCERLEQTQINELKEMGVEVIIS